MKFLDMYGLSHLWGKINTYFDNLHKALLKKVDKDGDKVLSDNNYSDDDCEKLDSIEEGAQANVIEHIQVNGVKVDAQEKTVNLELPTPEEVNSKVSKSGDTIEGDLDISGNLFASYVCVPDAYDSLLIALAGTSWDDYESEVLHLLGDFDPEYPEMSHDVIVRGVKTPNKDKDAANKRYVDDLVGDIETALDNIISMQNTLIGGESV